ncbi:7-carboxy-7-deazaguanine synthase QueE [Microtetraspora fusca]|uniref:7-carboxy-7-deazaguanine synthase n=1 Tax=Microtetraspora fusca TaxID=1997 RepID=A0ABW6VGU3_MICFU
MTTTPTADTHATDTTLVVSEVFGPTVQGEGPSLGVVASFVRLSGCNLACAWCDAAYTWDADRFDLRQELQRVPVAEILTTVESHRAGMVVITGGEPLLHQKQHGWDLLLDGLAAMGRRIEVETNGTVRPTRRSVLMVDAFNVSPKLGHSHLFEAKRINPLALREFNASGKAVFKVVCRTADDVDEVASLTVDHDIPSRLVWIMPEGRSASVLADVSRRIIDRALHYRFNFTPRLHIHLWGDERGH